jgi:O-antigen ligase
MKKLDGFLFGNLLLIAVLAPLAYGTVEDWSIALFELNALLLALLLAVKFVFAPAADWRQPRLVWPLLALWLLTCAQIFVPGRSFDLQATKESAIKLFALLSYFIVAAHLLRDGRRRRVLWVTLTLLGASVALFAIVQKMTYNGKLYWLRPVSPYVAPFGPFANYNHFAGMMELLLPLPFAQAIFARSEAGQRAMCLFAVVVMAAALFYSLSRGGVLMFGVQFAVLLWLAWRGQPSEPGEKARRNRLWLAGGVLALICVFTLWIGYDNLLWRFQSFREGASEHSVVTRLAYWRAAWRMFLDHPLTGVGLGAFPAVYPHYGHASAKLERLEKVHNDYLQLLTDAGLFGALLLCWFVIELLRQLLRQMQCINQLRSQERALLIGGYVAVLGLAVHSLFDFNLQITANALLFLLVLACVASLDKVMD